MIITYLRSSSYGCHELCSMKYYIEYILGHKSPPNIKAEKGTIVHKALEILAQIKLSQQNGEESFKDDILGEIDVNNYSVDNIVHQCYDFYSNRSPNTWDALNDLKEVLRWTDKAITYNNGEFDPRNSNIVAPEQSFDIKLEKEEFLYEYILPDGQKLEGFLALKGTIDQVSKIDDETYMILDWKTGRRWDWAKDEEKTREKLQNDPQLMMYYYAAQHIYPDIPHILVTIYFINSGGPFSVCFSKDDNPRIERMLQKKFEDIKHTVVPARNITWKCKKFCHYGKNTFHGTGIQTIKEKRPGQICNIGDTMTMCEQTAYALSKRPEETVREHMSDPNHDIDYYQAPGEA